MPIPDRRRSGLNRRWSDMNRRWSGLNRRWSGLNCRWSEPLVDCRWFRPPAVPFKPLICLLLIGTHFSIQYRSQSIENVDLLIFRIINTKFTHPFLTFVMFNKMPKKCQFFKICQVKKFNARKVWKMPKSQFLALKYASWQHWVQHWEINTCMVLFYRKPSFKLTFQWVQRIGRLGEFLKYVGEKNRFMYCLCIKFGV